MFGRKKAANPAAQAITGQIVLSATLGSQSGRTMQVSFYAYDGESRESLEARTDLFQEIIERQLVRSEIPVLEATREQRLKGLEQAREVLAELEERQKNGQQLSSQERLNLKNMRVNIAKAQADIDKGTEAIREAKLKAGVG